MAQNTDDRAVIVLQQEMARMRRTAERIDLVVQAMALRRGLRPTPIAHERIEQFD